MTRRLSALLAGLEAGTLGGVVMLGWLAVVSLWQGRSIWSVPNLLASTFYGESALRRGFRWSTLSGVSLHFFISAALGIVFALAVRRVGGRALVMLLGLLFGIAWYYLGFKLLWARMNPLVVLYSPGSGMLVGHLMWGVFLGSVPRYLRGIESGMGPA